MTLPALSWALCYPLGAVTLLVVMSAWNASRPALARPPDISGVRTGTGRDAARLAVWAARGALHGARKGSAGHRVMSAVGALFLVLFWPHLWALQWTRVNDRNARVYLSGDASLTVTATRTGWELTEHLSARPGTGQGKPLRDHVTGHLIAAATDQRVPVKATAATPALAQAYRANAPQLRELGRTCTGRVRLRYKPDPAD